MRMTMKQFLEAANESGWIVGETSRKILPTWPKCEENVDEYEWTDLLTIDFESMESWDKCHLGELIFLNNDTFNMASKYLIARFGLGEKLCEIFDTLLNPYPDEELEHFVVIKYDIDPDKIAKKYPGLNPDEYLLAAQILEIGHHWISYGRMTSYENRFNFKTPYLVKK